MKVLITGKNSYIGNSFAEFVADKDVDVTKISVRDDVWRGMAFSEFDVVLHVAAVVHQKQSKHTYDEYKVVNTDLPVAIAKKAKAEGVKQFVFISTIAIYGLTGQIKTVDVIADTTQKVPTTYYGETKFAAEKQLTGLADDSFKLTIVRPPMVYGKAAPGNYGQLAKLAKLLPILPKVENKRSMIFIDNLSSFLYQVITNTVGGEFIPQNSELVNTNDLMVLIRKVHGKKTSVLPFGQGLVHLGAKFTGLMSKVYGNLVVDQDTDGVAEYRVADLKTSVEMTER